MIVTIVSVHPARTVVHADGDQFELPTNAFSTRPVAGQTWDLTLNHQRNEREQIELLNQHLRGAPHA